MKERPILFSGEMVRAILDGRKTQTRRVVKEPICIDKDTYADAGLTWYGNFGLRKPCKFGSVGDRLWVKETHRWDGVDPKIAIREKMTDALTFRADFDGDVSIDDCKWKPSIFMPRWASRITLEIVSVRVDRLQDISEEDAKAEGVRMARWFVPEGKPEGQSRNLAANGMLWNQTWEALCYRNAYATLWEKINGAGSWDKNPWVWVIEFKKIVL